MNVSLLRSGTIVAEKRLPPLQQIQVVRYAGASGDFNPIHTVPEAAARAGLPSTIAHGMLSMGLLGTLLTDWMGFDAELRRFGVRFTAMTFPGDELRLTATVVKVYALEGRAAADLDLSIVKADGSQTVKGWATIVEKAP